jgi:hypothetical protein
LWTFKYPPWKLLFSLSMHKDQYARHGGKQYPT